MTIVRQDGSVEFRFFRPEARDVRVAGDFNWWSGDALHMKPAGNGWWALFRHPDELARLRDDPDGLLATAIEELLRFDTPAQMFERWVLEDIVVADVEVSRGSEVALLLGSANHDPAVFAEPERLDLSRQDNPHVTFGAGIHYCLGAPLARMELEVSYAALLRRIPGLALAEEPRWKPGYVIRGLESLLVMR